MPSLVNQEQPSDIFHCAHFCVAPLLGAGPSFLEAFRLPGICCLATAIHPFKCPFVRCMHLHYFALWCSFSTAQHETSRAGCAEVRKPCSEWVFKRFPRKISKCNQQTFLIYSVFNPTIYNDSWQVKWFSGLHLNSAMTKYYKYALEEKEEKQCFSYKSGRVCGKVSW